MSSWRNFADWAKVRPATLRAADFMGRGRGRLRWFDHLNPPARAPLVPDLSGWKDRGGLGAVWIGHATMLLRIAGKTILTDPVFSNRIGIGLGLVTAGPRRRTFPAVDLHALPPLDLILVSHAHFDHLDRPTLARLPKGVAVVTSERNSDLLSDLGFRKITELRWGEHLTMGPLKITARQVKHWGARTFYDQHRGYAAFLLEAVGNGPRRRILYGADSAYQDYFQDLSGIDLAVLGIGAYDPYIAAHATPEQALEMANHMRAEHVLPMHHSTFKLSHEPMGEPIERMLTAARHERVVVTEVGGQWSMD